MGGPLNVQTDGLRQFSETHANVASQISQLVGGAPTASGVQTSHGPIALAVQNALGELLGSRTGSLQNTATSGNTISGLLSKAAKMYDDGDREGAARVKALAERMAAEQGGAPSAAGKAEALGEPKEPGPPPGVVGPALGGVIGDGIGGVIDGESNPPTQST